MPNTVRQFAHQIIKRFRESALSSSSPPSRADSKDVTNEDVDKVLEQPAVPKREVPAPVDVNEEDNNFCLQRNTSTDASNDHYEAKQTVMKESDVKVETESFEKLRIEDALNQSKKLQKASESSPRAFDVRKLMKELQRTKKASRESNGTFEVDLCPDNNNEDSWNLSEWEVRFYKFDESSKLWKSMQEQQIDCVKFHVTFPYDFPASPPFVRLISPYIENGFIMHGGAICLEILTHDGWTSAYTVEALLIQVAASLTQGGAFVSKHQKRKQHKLTKKRAEVEFRRITKIHNKYGWVNLDQEEG